jgi:site-specific DNA-methyltransferase (adenine-specific)
MREYLDWCAEWLKECERVLSPQGSLYVYGVEMQLEYLAVNVAETTSLEYRNRITLSKQQSYIKDLYGGMEHFRRFIPSSEFILFYTFKDETGLSTLLPKIMEPIQKYFNESLQKTDFTFEDVAEYLGMHKVGVKHYFDYPLSPRIPKEGNYIKLQKILDLPLPYAELKLWYEKLKDDARIEIATINSKRYTFNAKEGMTNVWNFEPDRGKLKTKHPTQKPLALCERIISISSNEGNTVLIPFVGSGSECVASARLKRNFIGFECEREYVEIANKRLDDEVMP